jgi:plastocyanin
MKMNSPLLTGTALLGSLALTSAADVSGKITLKGTPPPEIAIQMDETCGKLGPAVTTRHYVVGKDGGLGNVFVYVKAGLTEKSSKAPDAPVLIDQKDCMYQPYIVGAMVGQKIRFKNSDPLIHNVHATPDPAKGNKEFNDAQPANFPDIEKSFDKPEVLLRVKCDVHQWMFTYVGVVDHPYFAVSDKDGNFTIKGLPNGKYTICAYHLKTHGKTSEGVTQEVTVDGDKKVDLTVELPPK